MLVAPLIRPTIAWQKVDELPHSNKLVKLLYKSRLTSKSSMKGCRVSLMKVESDWRNHMVEEWLHRNMRAFSTNDATLNLASITLRTTIKTTRAVGGPISRPCPLRIPSTRERATGPSTTKDTPAGNESKLRAPNPTPHSGHFRYFRYSSYF